MTHYHALLAGYATALGSWIIIARTIPTLWPKQEGPSFDHPWREVGWAILASVAVIAVGQAYSRAWLLPTTGQAGVFLEVGNQVLIFSPLLLLLFWRKQGPKTAWLPAHRIWLRLLIGLFLALGSILAFVLVREGSRSWVSVVVDVYQPGNLPYLIQVLLEDIAIAILFVRLRGALSPKWAIVLVAAMFSAAHIPALLARGFALSELTSLILDAGLGVAAISVLQRSSDIWWFWCVHFAMDMMQFYAVP